MSSSSTSTRCSPGTGSSPQDRRGLLIELTPAGLRLIDEAVTDHVAAEHRLLTALSPAERDQLAGLLRTLLLGLPADSRGRGPE